MTKNEQVLLIILKTFSSKSREYINLDGVVFPVEHVNNIKTSCTYAEKIIKRYGSINYDLSVIEKAKKRLFEQSSKLESGENAVPEKDFMYLIIMELSNIYFTETLKYMKLEQEVKKNLKNTKRYIENFMIYLEKELKK